MRLLSVCVLSALALGCMGRRISTPQPASRNLTSSALIPGVPGEGPRCRVAASQSNPLLTEWPAAEKARLESLLARGPVAVSYSGCTMKLLDGCALPGGYVWQRTTPSTDGFDINDEDELYARLPLGAVSLSGDLKRWGKLTVRTRVAGLFELRGLTPKDIPGNGSCAQATHVIGNLAVGAYELSHGGGWRAGAGADVTVPAVGSVAGGTAHSEGTTVVRSAGVADVCGNGDAPNPNCRSPIQAFLLAIPGRAAEEGPTGTVKVDLISAHAGQRWDVYIDDEVVCSTPCSRWLDPSRPIFLRTRDDGFNPIPDKIKLANLAPYTDFGRLQLQARPTERGQFATGWTFAGLGIGSAFIGSFLWLFGEMSERQGMDTAGMITAGVGLALGAGGAFLIVDSMPKAEVYALDGPAPVKIKVGPTGVAAAF